MKTFNSQHKKGSCDPEMADREAAMKAAQDVLDSNDLLAGCEIILSQCQEAKIKALKWVQEHLSFDAYDKRQLRAEVARLQKEKIV
jgi:hypothetical protein